MGGLDSPEQLRSRNTDLYIAVKIKSRYLDCRDQLFESVEIFSTFETYFLTVSRSRVSIETRLRQIDTPGLTQSISSQRKHIL